MKIGFIGLGNVGGKLAGSLIRNNFDVTVREIDENLTNEFKKQVVEKYDETIKWVLIHVAWLCLAWQQSDFAPGTLTMWFENRVYAPRLFLGRSSPIGV